LSADWAFEGSRGRRELHPYPARFIAEIPGQALDLLGIEGTILDPFCGSGTTLAEARSRGVSAIGVDLNPIATLISRVRCERWNIADAAAGVAHADGVFQAALVAGAADNLSDRIPRVDHWFEPWAQRALAGALEYLESLDQGAIIWRDRIALGISAAIVRLSRQESDTRYAAIHKEGDQESAAKQLFQSMMRTCEWLKQNTSDYPDADVKIVEGDATDLSWIEPSSVDGAIFSPPYPNAYEYWLYHKYRMFWLGYDPIAVRENEIGARPHYCKANGMTELDFEIQMNDVFHGLRSALRRYAPVVVVIGDSTIGGRRIDNGQLIGKVAEANGFELGAHVIRPIAMTRSSFNRAHSRGRRDEHVMLFRAAP
jgi:site-specific DNA-methyltransferase (cytosine-N4-specific)